MFKDIIWEQTRVSLEENVFRDYKRVKALSPATLFWNTYNSNVNAPNHFRDEGIADLDIEYPLKKKITCKDCLKNGTFKTHDSEEVCISGCLECAHKKGWFWGTYTEKETMHKINCNGSIDGTELSDLDHMYRYSDFEESHLSRDRILELGQEIYDDVFYGELDYINHEKVVVHFNRKLIPERIIRKYILPVWNYIVHIYRLDE